MSWDFALAFERPGKMSPSMTTNNPQIEPATASRGQANFARGDFQAALADFSLANLKMPTWGDPLAAKCRAEAAVLSDLTVARLTEDAFYLVTGTGFATHDFDWIRRNIPAQWQGKAKAWRSLTMGKGRSRTATSLAMRRSG